MPNGGGSASRTQFEALAEAKFNPPTSDLGRVSELHGFADPRHGFADKDPRMSIGSTYSAAARHSLMNQGEGLLGTRRPRPHKIWKKKYIKLLVVGDSGLGKTTLIRSLMSTPGERLQVHDGSFTPTEQFIKDPESLCSTISWRDEDDRVIWVYRMQDTPGYGDTLDLNESISTVLDFVQEQNIKWLHLEQSRDRKEDMAEMEDPRIDLCLFCIGPHRLRPADLKFMYEIGLHVPVVPVVTKADTMTIREAGMYRTEVANKIANPMLPGIKDKINIFHFERDTMARAGVNDSGTPTPPFLVIASNDINEDLNSGDPPLYWPERRYPWGIAEAFNKDHSDLLSLRGLLLKEALEEINKTKRQRYESWRRSQLRGSFQPLRAFRRMLLFTVVPAIVCLQIGRSGLKVADVKKNVKNVYSNVRNSVGRHLPKQRKEIHASPAPVEVPAAAAAAAPPPPAAPQKKGWF